MRDRLAAPGQQQPDLARTKRGERLAAVVHPGERLELRAGPRHHLRVRPRQGVQVRIDQHEQRRALARRTSGALACNRAVTAAPSPLSKRISPEKRVSSPLSPVAERTASARSCGGEASRAA